LDVRELWLARRQGKFTLKHWLWAWLISARLMAVPWVALYTLFGALLAGFYNPTAALGSALTVVFILLAGHFFNNYLDVILGVDRFVDDPAEAGRVASTLKPYTGAAWLVPLRVTSIGFQRANAYAMLVLSAVAYVLLVPETPATLAFYILGVTTAVLYTPLIKPMRLGEVAAFLGHGFGTVTFGYLSQSSDILAAVLAGVPTGLISALAYSVDQFLDIKSDFVERVRSIYESWFNSRMPLGLYVLVIVAFYFNILVAWVAAGIYPRGVLLALAVLPLVLFKAPALEYSRDNALRDLALTVTWLLPALMCLGVLIP